MASNYDIEEEMVPTEQHRLNAEVETVYSVIVSGVDHAINPRTIKAKVISLDVNKKPKKSRQGVVFTEYVKPTDMKAQGLITKKMSDVATPKENLAMLNGSQKKAVNMLKKFINSNQCALFWHNGSIDDSCEFNTMHLHMIVGVLVSTEPLCRCKTWRTVRKEILGLEFDNDVQCKPVIKTQKVQSVDRLLHHLVSNPGNLKPSPRLCIGVNNIPRLKRLYSSLSSTDVHFNKATDLGKEDDYGNESCMSATTPDFMCDALGWLDSGNVCYVKEAVDDDPYAVSLGFELPDLEAKTVSSKAVTFEKAMTVERKRKEIEPKIPESKSFKNTMILVELMKKYKAYNKAQLFKTMSDHLELDGSDIDLSNFSQLVCHPQQKIFFENALAMIQMTTDVKETSYLMSLFDIDLSKSDGCLSEGETAELFLRWCKQQAINPTELAIDIYFVLSQYVPKKNTLYLQGQSDAGKTYWVNSLLPNKSLLGEMITSSDFAFQECVNKELILINELVLTTPEQAELHKKVWEGQPVTVNIKNKAAQIINRKPVICTSNNLVWQFQTNERIPFLNRSFQYLNLQKTGLIKEYGKPANSKFWQDVLLFIDEQVTTLQSENIDWTKFYELLDQSIHEYIEQLQLH